MLFSTKLSSKPALNTFGCGLLLSLKTKQRNPWNKHLKGKEYVCSRAFSVQDKIVEKCGDHPVSTDGDTWYLSTSVQVFKYGSSHSLPI